MNNQAPPTDTVQTKTAKKKSRVWLNSAILLITIILILLMLGAGYSFFELSRVNISLANKVSQLQSEVENNKNALTTVQTTLDDLKQTFAKAQGLTQQQEKLIQSFQAAENGHLEKWRVAEAQYLVNLATDHLQFTHDTTRANVLIERALNILNELDNAALQPLRQALLDEKNKLANLEPINTAEIYLKLIELDKTIDQLPLLFHPLAGNLAQDHTLAEKNKTWWEKGWGQFSNALQQIVIVRQTDAQSSPLVLPEEKTFLYLNLHAQMEEAILGLLKGNNDIYQTSLKRVSAWISQYFAKEADIIQNTQQTLENLQKINIQAPTINLSDITPLFDQYFGQSDQPKKEQ